MENPVSEMIDSAIKNMKCMVGADSVVGEVIRVDNDTVVIPIAKVSFGFGGGGSDMVSRHSDQKTNFAGGIGGGTTVKAEAFLVVSGGNVRIVPVNVDASTTDKIVDMVPNMVDKVSGFFANRKNKNQ